MQTNPILKYVATHLLLIDHRLSELAIERSRAVEAVCAGGDGLGDLIALLVREHAGMRTSDVVRLLGRDHRNVEDCLYNLVKCDRIRIAQDSTLQYVDEAAK